MSPQDVMVPLSSRLESNGVEATVVENLNLHPPSGFEGLSLHGL